jgi:preprotein translocase subunit YajC
MNDTTMTILLVAFAAVFIFFSWRSSRKRKAAAEEAKEKFVVGADVMTSYGLFGTITAVDGDVVTLESTPKTKVRIHRNSIIKLVVEDDSDAPKSVEEAMARANAEAEAKAAAEQETVADLGEPEFGERVEKKPVRRAAKKTAE